VRRPAGDGLNAYSTRNSAYIADVRAVIRANDLDRTNQTFLRNTSPLPRRPSSQRGGTLRQPGRRCRNPSQVRVKRTQSPSRPTAVNRRNSHREPNSQNLMNSGALVAFVQQ